jgi:hypothetical protein
LQKNKKSHDEMLLKKFKSIENTLFFKEKLWIFESDQLKLNIISMINLSQSIQTYVVHVNIFINDITDRRHNNR